MKYECTSCNYSTNDKSNFNKHLNRKKCSHDTQLQVTTSQNPESTNEKFICKHCHSIFTRQSNLSKHVKTCAPNTALIKLKELETKVEMLNKQNRELKEYIKVSKPGNTYNVSIKNYVKQNYPDAPPLEGMADYAKIKYDSVENEYEEHFIFTVVYHYRHHALTGYLGDFIIKCYKKDDPSQQSVWNSDVSRLTYIIKELFANKDSVWNHDYKGVKVKKCIIDPLLKYIRDIINQYWIVSMENFNKLETVKLIELQEILVTLQLIKTDIETGNLADNMIKYIAPHFYLGIKQIEDNLLEIE